MEDLRAQVRAGFERDQHANPMSAGMHERVARAALIPARRETSLQWAAVVAALLIGALLITALITSRVSHNVGLARPSATPAASPSPALVEDYGTPPAGVPLIYLQDPENASWYIGFDWSGTPRGTIKLAQAGGIDQSPDGSSFEIGSPGKGGTGQFLDRLGSPLSQSVPVQNVSGMWADDSTHICGIALDQQKFTWTLVTFGPNQPLRNVALVAQDSSLGQTGLDVAACSFKNDRAIVVRTTIASPSEAWLIRLSDGRVLGHSAFHPNANGAASIVASPDATLEAENAGPSTPSTYIWRNPISSGLKIAATLDKSVTVLAISADDSAALVTTAPDVQGQPSHLAVVDIATGRLVWSYDGPDEYAGSGTEPSGAGFAIRLKTPTNIGTAVTPIHVVIVRGDGTSVAIRGEFNVVRA